MIKGLPAGWGTCSRTVLVPSSPLAISFWNNTIAVGLSSGNIIILDAISGSRAGVFSGHSVWVWSVTFSSDGVFLASGGFDCTVKLWDTQTGGIIRTFSGHKDWVRSVSISADSTMIVSGSTDETIRLWNIQTGECCHVIEQQAEVLQISFLATDSKKLIAGSRDKVQQWDINGHKIGPEYTGSFSLDGTQFALCNESIVTVQNTESRAIAARFHVENSFFNHGCFSPDGGLIAASIDRTVYVWDIASPDPHLIETFIGHTNKISALKFSSPSTLISASEDNSVKFWQIGVLLTDPVETGSQSPTVAPVQFNFTTLQIVDGIIITSYLDGVVKTWDIFTGHCKGSFQTPLKEFDKRDFSMVNGRLIIAWCGGKQIHIWDAEKCEPLLEVAISQSDSDIEDIRISGDGSQVFCLNNKSIEAWSIWTGQNVGRVETVSNFRRFLTIEGSRVWAHTRELKQEGWDFEIPDLPVQLGNGPSSQPHPNGTILWNIGLSRVQDVASGNVLFQLNAGLGKPLDVQWNDKLLVACFDPTNVLIFDFSYVLLQ